MRNASAQHVCEPRRVAPQAAWVPGVMSRMSRMSRMTRMSRMSRMSRMRVTSVSSVTSLSILMGLALGLGGCVGPSSSGPSNEWSSKQRSSSYAAAAQRPMAPASSRPQGQIAVEADGDARTTALRILAQASDSSSPLLRANAIEALSSDPAAARPAIQRGLVDSNRGVRFVSAMSAGNTRMGDLAAEIKPMLRDEFPSVRAAAIFALKRCGQPVDPTPLAAMSLSEDPEVRGNAVFVLGELGNPTAIPLLEGALGRGLHLTNEARVRLVELQVAEAQVKLGNERAADPIRAALFAPPEQAELVILACQIAGRVKDGRSVTFLERLVMADGPDQRPDEIRLAALQALAEIGAAPSEAAALASEIALSPRADLRGQAATTLGALGGAEAMAAVTRLLQDSDPVVQVAAAGAVVRLTTDGRD